MISELATGKPLVDAPPRAGHIKDLETGVSVTTFGPVVRRSKTHALDVHRGYYAPVRPQLLPNEIGSRAASHAKHTLPKSLKALVVGGIRLG